MMPSPVMGGGFLLIKDINNKGQTMNTISNITRTLINSIILAVRIGAISLVFMGIFMVTAEAGTMALDIGTGIQSESNIMSVGLSRELPFTENALGIPVPKYSFVIIGVEFKHIYRRDSKPSNMYISYNRSHNRKDLLIKLGLGKRFGDYILSSYIGFGQSYYKLTDEYTKIGGYNTESGVTTLSHTVNNGYKDNSTLKEARIKLKYINGDISPFISLSKIKYSSDSYSNATVGISIRF